MITVTPSLATNTTLTPVVTGAIITTPPAAASALPEGFSAALNSLAQPSANIALLATPTPAMLAAITVSSATETNPALITAQLTDLSTNVTMQTVTTTNAPLLNSSTTGSATVAPQSTQPTMNAADTAILSTVTDTLKFITAGSTLGDTLPAGQTVQLPNANLATAMTQQSVQKAVNQAVTNTQVTTQASIVAQQVTPVSLQTSGITVPVNSAPIDTIALQIAVKPQTSGIEATKQSVISTLAQQTVVASQTTESQAVVVHQQTTVQQTQPVNTQQTQSVNTQQTQSVNTQQTQSVNTQQIQPVNAQQTQIVNAPALQTTVAVAPVQSQVVNTPQATAVQTTVPANVPVQTQVVDAQQAQANQAKVTTASSQTATTQTMTKVAGGQSPSQTATATTTQPVTNKTQPVIVTQVETQKTAATPVLPPSTEQIQQGDTVVRVNSAPTKTAKQTPVTNDATTMLQSASVAEPSLVADQGVNNAELKANDNVATTTVEPEHKKAESSDISTLTNTIIVPQQQATAQATQAQATQAQVENTSVETSTHETTVQEKSTLTSAKTLLMDVVANRNNSGDTANNSSNNGGNSSSNQTLQNDSALNQNANHRQSTADLKTFASLLSSEKSDAINASVTAPTGGDKSSSQVINAAVNKLVQDTKVDVPAMTKPLSHPEWNNELGERIVWMNKSGISSAEIRMNPQNMGPISVRIDMNQDQATIAFTAQNSVVRDALEASIPKLREMLNSQQMNLADVSVSQQSASNDSSRQQQTAQMMADASANNGQGNRQANREIDADGNPVRTGNDTTETVDEFANGQVLEGNGTNGLMSFYA